MRRWDLLIGRTRRANRTGVRALLRAAKHRVLVAVCRSRAPRQQRAAEHESEATKLTRGARLEAALAAARIGLCAWDLRSNEIHYSRELERQLGGEKRAMPHDVRDWRSRMHPDDRKPTFERIRASIAASRSDEFELRMRHADGCYRWMLVRTSLEFDDRGRAIGLLAVHVDITERKREQLASAAREQRLRRGIEHIPLELAMFDRDMRYLAASEGWRRSYRLDERSLLGRSHYEVFPEIPERWKQIHQRCLAGAVERCDEDRFPRADGTVDWLRWDVRPWREFDGSVGGLVIFSEVITGRRYTQKALHETQAHLHRVSDTVPHIIWELTPEGNLRYANRAWHEYFGCETVVGCRWSELVHPDDLVTSIDVLALESDQPLNTVRLRRHDGVYRWFSSYATPVRDDAGTLLYVVGSSTDVHALKTTQDALRESQARLFTALRAAGMGTWRWDVDLNRVTIDTSLAQLLGCEPGSFEATSLVDAITRMVPPDDVQATERAVRRAIDEGPGSEFAIEWRVLRPDDSKLWLTTQGRVEADPIGSGLTLVGASVDVTRHKRLEEQLRQAQKMEAIGQLAGGVAHDFNNILTVILGHTTMLAADPRLAASELAEPLREVVDAAERAASLTRQLLVFGRRQVMQVRQLDLNAIVADLMTMLLRLIGEHIECSFEPASDPVWVLADPASLTQVILNLAVNARDAMPTGGRLHISVRVTPLEHGPVRERGDLWAQLRVSDSGCGIATEVLPHIFDPFFTTKGVGQGTGLGLATVYGIVEQHRGHIDVESDVEHGTTFIVSLPLAPS